MVIGNTLYVGTAQGVTGTALPLVSLGEPSRIFAFNLTTGALEDTLLVQGEDTTQPHGLAGLKSDADGRLYASAFAGSGPGARPLGVLRFTRGPQGWQQETYAEVPDLALCALAPPPCSPTQREQSGIANDMTWDAAGNLYFTDSWQASVWRVPPGPSPRTPELWYQHPDLDRLYGANGLRIGPAGDRMFVAVCCPDSAQAGPVDRAARIVTVPFPEPAGAAPTLFARFPNGEGPDGIAFDEQGQLWVVSNVGEKVLVLGPDGAVVRILTNADLTGGGAMHFPASIAFRPEARSILLTNYDYTDPRPSGHDRGVVEVVVDALPFPEALPRVP